MSKMNELVEAGLFGRGLIPITSQVLVDRYNACLQALGLKSTTLSTFQVDRLGWSPEIAEEMGDDYYLSHGDANPLCIILTPEQATAPIYFPMHSFDWKLMKQWFELNRAQIADITKDSGIILDIDQEVSLYAIPTDLLMVSEVQVRANTPCGFMDRANEQRALVKRWLKEKDAHLDDELITALEETAKRDGDLRRRQLVIRDMQYSDVADFYSRVFGGVFVLRSQNHQPLIFVREEDQVDGDHVLPADESALSHLIEHGYVETDVQWWKDHLYRLKVVAESFLVEVLDQHEPRINFSKLAKSRCNQLIVKHRDELGTYLDLMRARDALKRGQLDEVSDEVRPHLLHPSEQLSPISREVVWQILTYIRGGRFVPLLYRHQKTKFVELYNTKWKKPRRTWALTRIREHYDIASKSSGLEL